MVKVESLVPTLRQAVAYRTPERYVLYGGAMGGGKSVWLVGYAIELSMRYPGNRGYLCRHELQSFKKTTQISLDNFLSPELVDQHNRSDNFYRFKNGSVIMYGGLGDDKRAIDKLKSMELGWFGIDQAEETSEKFFFMLTTRLRLSLPGMEYKGLLTANPAPNWVKARFIDRALPDHAFIPALPKDNPYNPSDYEERLREVLPAELVEIWVGGDWEAIAETNNVFSYRQVLEAIGRQVSEEGEEEYGVDVAEYGGDETVVARKKGRRFSFEGIWRNQDPMETVGKIIRIVNQDKRKVVKVDAIGPGNGVYHRLNEQGYNVIAIKGSESPVAKNKYRNLKTEIYYQLREALPGISFPDDPVLRSQLTSCQYKVLSSDGLIRIESKEELRKSGRSSPDRMEAIIYANAKIGETADIFALEEESPFVPWHKEIEERERANPDMEVEAIFTQENARKYLELMSIHKNIGIVSQIMGVDEKNLRKLVSKKRDELASLAKGGTAPGEMDIWEA